MTAEEKLTSVPTSIRAACVADGYLVLIGMALAMIGISDLADDGFFDVSFLSIDGIAWMILASLILVVVQLYIISAIWQIQPWAWTAGIVMLAGQALLFAGILVWVQTTANVPVSYADGLIQWLLPLVVSIACLASIFDNRSWFR